MVITPPIAPGDVTADVLVTLDAAAGELPAGTAPETWAHLAVYRARPDVGAVARAQPEVAFAAAAIAEELAPLHGQACLAGPARAGTPGGPAAAPARSRAHGRGGHAG